MSLFLQRSGGFIIKAKSGGVVSTGVSISLSERTGPRIITQPTLEAPANSPSDPLQLNVGDAEVIDSPPAGSSWSFDWSLDRESTAGSGVYDVNLAGGSSLTDPSSATITYTVQEADVGYDAVLTVTWKDESGSTEVSSPALSLTLSVEPYAASGSLSLYSVDQSQPNTQKDYRSEIVSATTISAVSLEAGTDPVPDGVTATLGGGGEIHLKADGTTVASLGDKACSLRVTNSNGPTNIPITLHVCNHASSAASVAQDGVSLDGLADNKTAGNPVVGQYITGDWWVCLPDDGSGITITSTTPASFSSSDAEWVEKADWSYPSPRWVHGLQKDYQKDSNYDATFGFGSYPGGYDHAMNLDPGASGSALVVTSPCTLMKAKSLKAADAGLSGRPSYDRIPFFTVVSEIPPDDALRPHAWPGNKTWPARWSEATGKPASLPRISGLPSVASTVGKIQRPHQHQSGRHDRDPVRHAQAKNSGEQGYLSYTAEFSYSPAELALIGDEDMSAKEVLLIAWAQQGIDGFGSIKNGQNIKAADGNSNGRKFALAFAATLFDDQEMRDLASGQTPRFSEDAQTFYVSADDCFVSMAGPDSRQRAPRDANDPGWIGLADWGGQHLDPAGNLMQPHRSGSHWSMAYRAICRDAEQAAAAVAQIIPGMKDAWDRPEFFDYYNRIQIIEPSPWKPELRQYFETPAKNDRPEIMGNHDAAHDFQEGWVPGGLLKALSGGFEVTLNHNPNRVTSRDGEATYDIRYLLGTEDPYSASAPWTEVTGLSAGDFPYSVTGLSASTPYYVQVRMVYAGAGGPGPWGFWWINQEPEGGVVGDYPKSKVRWSDDGSTWTESVEFNRIGKALVECRDQLEAHPHVELSGTYDSGGVETWFGWQELKVGWGGSAGGYDFWCPDFLSDGGDYRQYLIYPMVKTGA